MQTTYSPATFEEANHTLNSILDIISEGVWDWNANTGHVHRSPSWYKMLGYDIHDFRNNVFTWENIIHPDDYPLVMQHFDLYITGEIPKYEIEYRCKKFDGTYLWIVDVAKIIQKNDDGTIARMIGAHQDIHEVKMIKNDLLKVNQLLEQGTLTLEALLEDKNKELEQKNEDLKNKIKEIEYLLITDPLTKISNRRIFEIMIDKEIARAQRYQHSLSITLIDIDFFKKVNDQYGHKYGDKVLCELSALLKKNLRENDFLARWGGEEFAIIFPETNLEQSIEVSEKLRHCINQLQFDNNLSITCSFGNAQYRFNEKTDNLFVRADNALYTAKKLGRNRVENIV